MLNRFEEPTVHTAQLSLFQSFLFTYTRSFPLSLFSFWLFSAPGPQRTRPTLVARKPGRGATLYLLS